MSLQLAKKRNAEGAFLKMFMGDEVMAANYGSTLLFVDNPASIREKRTVLSTAGGLGLRLSLLLDRTGTGGSLYWRPRTPGRRP